MKIKRKNPKFMSKKTRIFSVNKVVNFRKENPQMYEEKKVRYSEIKVVILRETNLDILQD